MGTKNWPHRPGTCRALIWATGPHIVVCHPCRRYRMLPSLEVPFDPCPFVCRECGNRAELMDAADTPDGYVYVAPIRTHVPPKRRWKPTR